MDPKELFYSSLEEEMEKLTVKRRDNYVIDTAKYEAILSTLKLKKGEGCERVAHFKQWRVQNFKLVTIGAIDYVYDLNSNVLHSKLPFHYLTSNGRGSEGQ